MEKLWGVFVSVERIDQINWNIYNSVDLNHLRPNQPALKQVDLVDCKQSHRPSTKKPLFPLHWIFHELKSSKSQKGSLAAIWLDIANAYGSVPHQLIFFALRIWCS